MGFSIRNEAGATGGGMRNGLYRVKQTQTQAETSFSAAHPPKVAKYGVERLVLGEDQMHLGSCPPIIRHCCLERKS